MEFVEAAEFVVGPCEADDVGAPACVGRQGAVVAVAMCAGRGNQPGESLEFVMLPEAVCWAWVGGFFGNLSCGHPAVASFYGQPVCSFHFPPPR